MLLPFAPRGSARSLPPDLAGRSPSLVAFRPGQRDGVVEGAVLRGERERYTIVLRAGQRLSVELRCREQNAVFDIRLPVPVGTAPMLADLRIWSGIAPVTGPVLIEVSPVYGNATYRMHLRLD
ncbi:hypothetical protein JMJ55_06010 [Belnapia sp. T6]|uniref:Uncharacterized protein n=1 Tax=Belnapia mucosa TaxID=2804532 RepID=A0ABS1UZI9_9PROT|nr:hypothetical protein [Belnapia mucosa]MBL6454869.1 hypothetical protein [Belnapia mucosa]